MVTPREAVARALARHVFENEEGFERDVDTFVEDLRASGYYVGRIVEWNPWTKRTSSGAPPDRPNEPRLHVPAFNVTGEPNDVVRGMIMGGGVVLLLGALALLLHLLGVTP